MLSNQQPFTEGMFMWPERIKTRGPYGSTALVDYEYRPRAGVPVRMGKTSVNHNGLGSSQLVFDTKKTRWNPGTLKLGRVQMRKTTHTATDDNYSYDPRVYPYPMVRLKGPIAGLYLPAVPDPTVLGMGNSWNQSLAESALLAAYAKWGQPSADVGLMLGEAGETLNFLRAPFSTFSKLYTNMHNAALSRRRVSRIRRASEMGNSLLGFLTDLWMSGRYGLLPVMSDIDSILKLAEEKLERPANVPFFRVSGSESAATRSSSLLTKDILILRMKWNVEYEEKVKVTCIVFYKLSWWYVGRIKTLEALGLDPTFLPSVLYETIPLSFVFDWIIDVGTWLQAHRPRPGYVYLGNCVSCKTTRTVTWTNVDTTPTHTDRGVAPLTDSKGFQVDQTIDRNVNLLLPSAPGFGNGISALARRVDALSLIWQRLPKRPR